MNTPDLDRSIVETAYARWEPVHGVVCGPVMMRARGGAAATAARAAGGRILYAPVCFERAVASGAMRHHDVTGFR
jgi:hypothetical protein